LEIQLSGMSMTSLNRHIFVVIPEPEHGFWTPCRYRDFCCVWWL